MVLINIYKYLTYKVNWTEEGHRWSWRMKLRDKIGISKFYINDKEANHTIEVDNNTLLTKRQQVKISCRPELLHLYAHEIANRYQKSTGRWPMVTAEVICSLNFRPFQLMVIPDFDLASILPWTEPNEWVIDLVPRGENSTYVILFHLFRVYIENKVLVGIEVPHFKDEFN